MLEQEDVMQIGNEVAPKVEEEYYFTVLWEGINYRFKTLNDAEHFLFTQQNDCEQFND